MKNIFTYVDPSKQFTKRCELMAEVQIDNSLDLGWKPKDIIFVTNFPYEYHGVKAHVGGDDLCYLRDIKASKYNILIYLLKNKIVNELSWIHDLDSFQLASLDLPPLDRDLGLVDYSYNPLINTGNIFFKPTALDVFEWIREGIDKRKTLDELLIPKFIKHNFNNFNSRFRRLNVTYNIGMRKVEQLVSFAEKPVKIAHFPPENPAVLESFRPILPEKLFKMLYEKFASVR